MAGKSTIHSNDYLKLVFNNVAMPLVGDASGVQPSAAAGNLYLSLHTSDPTDAGDQTTNETAYTGYARIAVARTTGGFTVTSNSVRLAANADFGNCTAAPGSPITHIGIGTSATGTGKLLFSGTLSPSITMQVGAQPRITTAANLVVED